MVNEISATKTDKSKLKHLEPSFLSHGSGNSNRAEDALIASMDKRDAMLKVSASIKSLQDHKLDFAGVLKNLTPEFTLEIINIALTEESAKVRLDALKSLLEMAGHGAVKKTANVHALVDASQPKEQLISLIQGLSKKTKALEIDDEDG